MEEEKQSIPEVPQPNGSVFSKTQVVLYGAVALVGIAAIASFVTFFLFRNQQGAREVGELPRGQDVERDIYDALENIPTKTPDPNEVLYLHTNSFFAAYTETLNGRRNFTPSLEDNKIKITWYKGAHAIGPEMQAILDEKTKDIEKSDDGYGHFYMYTAGVVSSPDRLAGKNVYLISEGSGGMGIYFSADFALFDEVLHEFIYLEKSGSSVCDQSLLCKSFVVQDFSELTPPDVLDIPNEDSLLAHTNVYIKREDEESAAPVFDSLGAANNHGGIVDVQTGELVSIPAASAVVFTDPIYGPVYRKGKQFAIVLPDGAMHLYDLVPDFFAVEEIKAQKEMYDVQSKLSVQWIPKYNTTDAYVPSGDIVHFCGRSIGGFPNIVTQKDWFKNQELIKIGETNHGDGVYTMKNPENNTYYKDVFDIGYQGSKVLASNNTWDEEKQIAFDAKSETERYADFLSDNPIIFWQDHWGDWRAYRKAKYQTLAECAKPVIYLYPENEMDVRVQVNPEGGFKYTDPAYGDEGWFVRATPKGEIKNLADGISYEYLFWEGYEYNYEIPCYGFVMSREDVPTKMYMLLSQLGLNERESADFMDFWQEKLVAKPYVYVTFVSQQVFDDIAPLTVEPQPDSIIRVFMDYQPLDYPMYVSEPIIKTPERIGFTVVEWGGRLR